MCATRPAPTAEETAATYTAQPGDLPVGVIPEATALDERRNRRLDLTIEYPISEGTFPLIIFSTGFGTPSRTYVSLSSYWASHGYVVMKVGHPGTDPENASVVEAWRDQTPEQWRNRTVDIKFLIDGLPTLQERYPELQGKIDPNRIGVGGHSYGAFVAVLLAGARTFTDGMATSYADPRVKAVVAMSPHGPGESRGLATESWRDVRIPVMYISGSSDVGVTEAENQEWRKQAYELSPAGGKWWVSIAGAGHLAFTGRTRAPVAMRDPDTLRVPVDDRDPRRTPTTITDPGSTSMPRRVDTGFYGEQRLVSVVRTVSLAFWDAYLENEDAGRDYLAKLSGRADLNVESK